MLGNDRPRRERERACRISDELSPAERLRLHFKSPARLVGSFDGKAKRLAFITSR
jgi:hypothetical protein